MINDGVESPQMREEEEGLGGKDDPKTQIFDSKTFRHSREDEEARRQLWDQIRREAAVTSRPDDVIPYTEIRTTGNAFNVRKRRPHVSEDEMVDALPVVTKVSSNNQRMRKKRNPKLDWDTKISGFQKFEDF